MIQKKYMVLGLCVFLLVIINQSPTPLNGKIEEESFKKPHTSSPDLLWHQSWDFGEEDSGKKLAVDSQGNIYIAGDYEASQNDADGFIVKYTPSGDMLWSSSWNGSIADRFFDIAIDSKDNIYAAGWMVNNSNDVCLVKYAPNGTQLWNRTWGCLNNDRAWAMSIDGQDNIYLTGVYNETQVFIGPDHFPVGSLLVLKYNSSGDITWSYLDSQWLCTMQGQNIEVDTQGNVYVFGINFTKEVGTGRYIANYIHLKLNMSGHIKWRKTQGEMEGVQGVISEENEIYVTSAYFAIDGTNYVRLKTYDTAGELIWETEMIFEECNYSVRDITTDNAGKIFITGVYTDSIEAGNVFLLVYDLTTEKHSFTYWGGSGIEKGQGITINTTERAVYISGENWAPYDQGLVLKYSYDTDNAVHYISEGGGGSSSNNNDNTAVVLGYPIIFLISALISGIILIFRKQTKTIK